MTTDGYGDAEFTTVYEPGPVPRHRIGVRCDRADPKIRISPVLIWNWHADQDLPGKPPGKGYVRPFDAVGTVQVACTGTSSCPIGDTLTINCTNRRLIYRITGSEPKWIEGDEPVTYLAEWPD